MLKEVVLKVSQPAIPLRTRVISEYGRENAYFDAEKHGGVRRTKLLTLELLRNLVEAGESLAVEF